MNISDTIAPKVDQLTADHLIGRTMTIRITGVRLTGGEQPCDINYEGDGGLPYRPGKSMRRVLVHVWGGDVNKYVGRSLTLYRDDDVQFGGLKVGGIRISHMSHIDQPVVMALTAKKGSKKAFKVQPLRVEDQSAAPTKAQALAQALAERIDAARDVAALAAITSDPKVVEQRAWFTEKRPELADWLDGVLRDRLAALDAAAGGDDTMAGGTGGDTAATGPTA